MTVEAKKFIEGTTFTGIFYPRFKNQPNGPQEQSMSLCRCGARWQYHRCGDGACPVDKDPWKTRTIKK